MRISLFLTLSLLLYNQVNLSLLLEADVTHLSPFSFSCCQQQCIFNLNRIIHFLTSLKALKGGEQMHGQLFCFLFSQYYYRIKNMISCDTKAQGYCFSIANLCCIFCHAVLGAVTFCCVISCAQVISFFQIGLLQAGSKDTAVNSSSFLTRCMFSTTLLTLLSFLTSLCVL